jgi:hypothetical protein
VRHLGFRTTQSITAIPANTTISQPVLLSPTITTPSITGNTTTAGFILPSANTTYDLGSPSLRWSNIYGSTLNLSGGQIAFPATQNSSADANTLDDYEEGTWTATYNSGTIISQTCTYTKIGRVVTASFQISWTQSGTTFGRISGLPFNVATINYLSTHSREWYSTGLSVQCFTSIGSAIIDFSFYNNSVAVTNGSIYGLSGTLVYHI